MHTASTHFKIYEFVAVLSCTFVLMAHSKPTASFNPSLWELSWSDEFDYSGKPNPEIWDYEHGYLGFNEELQNYTDHSDNVRVADGILIIEAHLKDVSAQRSKEIVKELEGSNAKTELLGSQEFTSARLITRGKKEFVHSRVEARARFTTAAAPGLRFGFLEMSHASHGHCAVRWTLWNMLGLSLTTFIQLFIQRFQTS